MSQVEERLHALGHTVPEVVPPVASYVPAVRDGRHVYVSGQLPLSAGTLAATGTVGTGEGCVVPEQAAALAELCALNAIAACKSVIGDLDQVERVVKLVGFVASESGFTGQPGVINGASDLMKAAFGDAGAHARSAVGVAALPLGAPVEVEAIFAIRES
ncbi:hypothetical protein KEM60_01117 [Austwickia sp. TVS 96-490-7B]|uniref:RidA family protein n=1 Tax=Austwickia sp. TVS 96-490-7B TaxID=2830843 RepID=UPI001C562946|nr:RidA family protein [Austwickia sp. TVS 96-490-7B]MBW3084927.1 hypothetical protein [Austwickia sp. TVS 96-490-7B]